MLAMIEKGHHLEGQYPSDESLDRAKRVLTGKVTVDEARQELFEKYIDK